MTTNLKAGGNNADQSSPPAPNTHQTTHPASPGSLAPLADPRNAHLRNNVRLNLASCRWTFLRSRLTRRSHDYFATRSAASLACSFSQAAEEQYWHTLSRARGGEEVRCSSLTTICLSPALTVCSIAAFDLIPTSPIWFLKLRALCID